VLSALKADPELADIPVVMETIVQEKGLAFSLGAEDYITKPIQWPKLKKVLDRFRENEQRSLALMVDDDGSTQALLAKSLEQEGWTVEQVATADEALGRFPDRRPALVLVDLNMTAVNAFAVIRDLHRREGWRDVPVVALSSDDLSAEERQRLEGHVQQIVNTDADAPQALLGVLRKLPSVHRSGAAAGAALAESKHGQDSAR